MGGEFDGKDLRFADGRSDVVELPGLGEGGVEIGNALLKSGHSAGGGGRGRSAGKVGKGDAGGFEFPALCIEGGGKGLLCLRNALGIVLGGIRKRSGKTDFLVGYPLFVVDEKDADFGAIEKRKDLGEECLDLAPVGHVVRGMADAVGFVDKKDIDFAFGEIGRTEVVDVADEAGGRGNGFGRDAGEFVPEGIAQGF